jgi:uncharacterized protein YbjT (DUF2867 family)
MRVLVYGATGSQMRALVSQLIERGHRPRVLTRNPAAHSVPAGAEVVAGDLGNHSSLIAASRDMDAVAFMRPAFVQHPERSLEYAASAAQAAAETGVRLIVWNTSGRYPMPGERRDSDLSMLAMHEQLTSAGVPLIAIAPTTYIENLLGPWTLNVLRGGQVAYPVLAERKMGWIASRDLCSLMAAALERPQLAGRLFRVSGVEAVTGPELAATFSDVLGRRFSYRTLTPAEMKASLEAAFGPGAGDAVSEEYALDQADPDPPLKYYDMSAVLRELPVKMTTVRQWIHEHRQVFAAHAES